MSYGRNFGMRSFENIVRVGRFRAPAGGTPFRIGAPITIDEANAGLVKEAADAQGLSGSGLAVFEHIQNKSDALTTAHDDPYDKVPLGQYVQIVSGKGAKVWFRNTAAKTLYDGRVRAAVTMISTSLASVAPGDRLTPNGTGGFKKANGTSEAEWFVVEQVNATSGLVEARFLF